MATVVKGLDQFVRNLKKFEPDLRKSLDKELRATVNPIVKKMRGYIPNEISGLSNWSKPAANTDAAQLGKKRPFPRYNPGLARKGIKFLSGRTKPDNKGFVATYRISNTTGVGAIFETAGRKNENAGTDPRAKWFNDHVNAASDLKGENLKRGRALFRAWDEDQGRIIGTFQSVLSNTLKKVAKI